MKNDLSNTEIAPATTLPESVRIPLHSLHADLGYLIGRVIADGSCGPMIIKSMRDRLDQIEAYFTGPAATPVTVCSLCLGTGKVFHENPPRKDTPYSRCHCQAAPRPAPEGEVDGSYFTECNYPKCGCARFGRCENAVKDGASPVPRPHHREGGK